MKLAMLCPGPSLGTWPIETFKEYDARMAVNRAILYAPCEYWVGLDWKTLCRYIDPPACILFTDKDCDDILRSKWERYGEFEIRVRPRKGTYSAVNALHHAKELGATEIHVYGADWTTEPDWDGVICVGSVRDAGRWAGESKQWQTTIEELGLSVTRHGPNRQRT